MNADTAIILDEIKTALARAASPWMTTKEAAAYLKVTEETIRNLRYKGKLKAYRITSTDLPRFKRADIDKLLA